jgi:hypothetical protein
MTTTASNTCRRTWWQWLGYGIKRATLAELHGYQSIYRFVLHRPRVPVGAVGFSYHRPILAILIVFIAVSAVEVAVVDLIVSRWPRIRIPFLVVGIWGLVWMLGLLFGMLTRPHAIGPDGLRIRYGAETDIPLAWERIDSVAIRKRTAPEKEPKVTVDADDAASLHLRINNETNLHIELDRPTAVRLPSGIETVSTVTLHADDPQGFLNEVRRHIG